jgi:hypothetical protein
VLLRICARKGAHKPWKTKRFRNAARRRFALPGPRTGIKLDAHVQSIAEG